MIDKNIYIVKPFLVLLLLSLQSSGLTVTLHSLLSLPIRANRGTRSLCENMAASIRLMLCCWSKSSQWRLNLQE